MKRTLLAVSALAIAGAAALTSANATKGAYAGDCRVTRERIETRRTGQPARLRVITISVKAAIPTRANPDARRNINAAHGSRAFAAYSSARGDYSTVAILVGYSSVVCGHECPSADGVRVDVSRLLTDRQTRD